MNYKIVLITTFLFIFSLGLSAQQQTAEGGYVIGGETDSFTHGSRDLLIYKLNAAGQKEWRKNYGGTDDERGGYVIQTTDGGYLLLGLSHTYTNGSADLIVYKLNAAGQKQWRKNYGGFEYEGPGGVIQTSDGGYAVAGSSATYSNGSNDFIVYKLDASGAKLWRKHYGGTEWESTAVIQQTADGGYIIGGTSQSYVHDWYSDFLAYKLSPTGAKEWRRNYGGTGSDSVGMIRQTSDDGYIFAGSTTSYTHPPVPTVYGDMLVYKLDAAGTKVWRKNYGGSMGDSAEDIRQTSDGGYLLTGYSNSYGDLNNQFLVYKLDAAGAKVWRKHFGGDNVDYASFGFQTSDGGYLIVGDGHSYNHSGSDRDFLLYKLDASGAKQWRKNFGGAGSDDVPGGGC